MKRPWLLYATAGLLCVGLLAAGVWWRSRGVWEEMVRAADLKQAELEAQTQTRPVLHGDPVTGARPVRGYAAAMRRLAELRLDGLSDAEGRGAEDWLAAPTAAGAECWAAVDSFAPVLEELRATTRGPDGRLALDWDAGLSGDLHVPMRVECPRFIMLAAWRALRDGREGEAVDLMLDAVQFGRDHMDDPVALRSMVGAAVIGIVADCLARSPHPEETPRTGAPPLVLDRLSRDALARLQRGLARADRPLPPLRRMIETEAVLFCREVQRVNLGAAWGGPFAGIRMYGSWRYGFSFDWMCAAAVTTQLQNAKELPPPDADWPTSRAALQRLVGKMPTSGNPILRMIAVNLWSIDAGRRRGVVDLRLLRTWVAEALGDIPAPGDAAGPCPFDDPFGGGRLLRRRTAEGVAWWSRGEDGEDGGGAGDDLVRRR